MRRFLAPLRSIACVSALAGLLLLTLGPSALAAEPAPTLEKPADQTSVTGKAIATVHVKGTELATLTSKELPAGLGLTKVSETEWTITGTPTTAKAAVTVTLEAQNTEKAPVVTTTFQWTVKAPEASPTLEKPADQTNVTGKAIATVHVKGTNLATLASKELPAGLGLTKVSETEWTITGTPTTAKAAVTVTLEAQNTEKAPVVTTTFKWTVNAPEASPTLEKPADQTSVVGKAITTVTVKGTNLATLAKKELPAGLTLTKVSQTEWTISGTPTTAKAAVTVTLEAQNTEKAPIVTTTFQWTVNAPEASPTLEKPPDQTSLAGTAIAPVVIKGTNLATLTDTALPAGLALMKVSETEWTISGIPTTPNGAAAVTLEAQNEEKAPIVTTTFQWTVNAPEAAPTLEKPADQTSTAGAAIATVLVKGSDLASLEAKELPAGLTLTKISEAEWTITGTPTAAKAATTVTLEAKNKEGAAEAPVTFEWTVKEAEKLIETPAKPLETPPPTTKIPSAGRLGTVPLQKPGKSLMASFLCEVASCQVQLRATLTVGKSKLKLHSARKLIKQGQKGKIALALTKKQQALISAALKKHKKVTASLTATIQSTVGAQVTKPLVVTVKR